MSENDKELQRLTERAAEMVKGLPEILQAAAFNRVFDELVSRTHPRGAHLATERREQRHPEARGGTDRLAQAEPRARRVVELIDRTKHPEVSSGHKALDLALMVLRVARDECQIEWLTASEISTILSEKFRISVGDSAIRMRLSSEGQLADRRKLGARSFEYRLMQPGDTYLDTLGVEKSSIKRPTRPARRKRTEKSVEAEARGEAHPSPTARPMAGTKKAPSGVSPTELLASLLREGFFGHPRTIGQIADQIARKKARKLKSTDLSPVLTRMIRKGDITRERNSDGQYEYTGS